VGGGREGVGGGREGGGRWEGGAREVGGKDPPVPPLMTRTSGYRGTRFDAGICSIPHTRLGVARSWCIAVCVGGQ
jgi:hypothetical protein